MKGQALGASNYSDADIDILLDTASDVLPVSTKGWLMVEEIYNEQANKAGRPTHAWKSLEAKFKGVCFFILCSPFYAH